MSKKIYLAPSILSANFSKLGEEIKTAELGGADMIHYDVMDGHFVPNLTFGATILRNIRSSTKLPFSVHLMIENPSKYLEDYVRAGANLLSFHAEAEKHIDRQIHYIKSHNVKAGVALNPGTPISAIENVLGVLDFVLVMTVNPGFGGQSYIPYAAEKIKALDEIRKTKNLSFLIEVDGGIGEKTAKEVVNYGADILVAGNAVFAHKDGIAAGIKSIKNSI